MCGELLILGEISNSPHTGRVHLDLETDDQKLIVSILAAQIKTGVPLRIDLTWRDGKYQLCVRELGAPEPEIIS